MAEIRKHNPTVTNAIDAALLEALGEPVKHVQPGAKPEPAAPKADIPHHVSVADLHVGEGSWLQVQPLRPQGTHPRRPGAEES